MRTNCGKILFAGMAFACAEAFGSLPVVTSCEMSQPGGVGEVTVKYKFTGADYAVVTLSIETNNLSGSWSPIRGEAVCNAKGEVWKKVAKVSDETEHVIKWRPSQTWKDADGKGFVIPVGGARAVVTAWATNNTPDYMVVDVSDAAARNSERYYPAVDYLPGSVPGQKGAITNNPAYKTTMLVMRKIMAKDITWTMGSVAGIETQSDAGSEATHQVTLDSNYYIGVFEITQSQYRQIATNSTVKPYSVRNYEGNPTSGFPGHPYRPMDGICYVELRIKKNSTDAPTSDEYNNYSWPKPPLEASFLGLLRLKTGLDFDLPSEAQWEFAARAGHGSGFWGNGTRIMNADTDDNLAEIARYTKNHASGDDARELGLAGSAFVGSYRPNDWGLYDMNGNVAEWCLDFYEADITGFGGAVNIDMENPMNTLSSVAGNERVTRGGAQGWVASRTRPAYRSYSGGQRNRNIYYAGCRVVCPVGAR